MYSPRLITGHTFKECVNSKFLLNENICIISFFCLYCLSLAIIIIADSTGKRIQASHHGDRVLFHIVIFCRQISEWSSCIAKIIWSYLIPCQASEPSRWEVLRIATRLASENDTKRAQETSTEQLEQQGDRGQTLTWLDVVDYTRPLCPDHSYLLVFGTFCTWIIEESIIYTLFMGI